MLKTLLLVLAVAGLHASPLRHKAIQFQHHAPIRKLPLLVQDQDRSAGQEFKAAPPELRRQGTEPSRRFLVDSYTGQLKEYISEMERRVGNLYEFRQGTEYLPATLSEHRTKYMMESMGKDADEVQMDVVATPIQGGGWVREAPRAVENQKAAPPELRRQGTEPSRRFLVDSYTGQLKDYVSEMERRVGNLYEFRQGTEYLPATLSEHRTKYMMESMGKDADEVQMDVVATPIQGGGWVREAPRAVENQKAAPPELRRQGTEPSRRFLVDSYTGQLKDYVSEMERRVGNLYEFRQGTEYLPATLSEHRTKYMMESMGKDADEVQMDVVAAPIQGGGWVREAPRAVENQKAAPPELRRQGTEPSRRFLVDSYTGQLKDYVSEMERRVGNLYEFRQGTEYLPATLSEHRTKYMMESMGKDADYVPPSLNEFRQGSQNSRVTLVDVRTGKQLAYLSEMERSSGNRQLHDNRLDTEHSHDSLMELQSNHIVEETKRQEVDTHDLMEFKHGIEYSQANRVDSRLRDPIEAIQNNEVGIPSQLDEFRRSFEYSQANVVDNHVMQPAEMNRKEVDTSPDLEEFKHGFEYFEASLMHNAIMQPVEIVKNGPETDLHPETDSCPGEVISGKCYYFNPTPQTFSEAESSCKQFSPNGHLASVTTAELHARLVAMVSKANSAPVLTWLGGVLKEKQFRWTDGSSWGYSDWMPGHPDTATDRKTCLEMFRTDESWWTAVDCGLKRASVCSFSMTA